jgi:Tfp pilus assembly protein FimT
MRRVQKSRGVTLLMLIIITAIVMVLSALLFPTIARQAPGRSNSNACNLGSNHFEVVRIGKSRERAVRLGLIPVRGAC